MAVRAIERIIGRDLSSNGTQPQRRIVCEYDYTDETGKLQFQVLRYSPKGFQQRRPNGQGGWVWNVKGVRLVPYRLPAVLKSEISGYPLYSSGEPSYPWTRAVGGEDRGN